jgi:hypothetical protein
MHYPGVTIKMITQTMFHLLIRNCIEVTFVYANENVNDIPQQFDSQSFQSQCFWKSDLLN